MNNAIAYAGHRAIASGALADVALAVKRAMRSDPGLAVLIFDAVTSRPVELDLRGDDAQALSRLPAAEPLAAFEPVVRGRGRPKLGVTAREVTLLPRHWDWLARQRGGASVTLRRLVDDARKAAGPSEGVTAARESLYRFMTAMAGDAPGYEEATRALFAGDAGRFSAQTEAWPADVRAHAMTLAEAAFA